MYADSCFMLLLLAIVAENIVGRDFLPRGAGIVTRRPLILQLVSLVPAAAASATATTGLVDKPKSVVADDSKSLRLLPGTCFTVL